MKKLLLSFLILLPLASFGESPTVAVPAGGNNPSTTVRHPADTLLPVRIAGDYFYEDKNSYTVSPYLLDSWTSGELILNNGTTVPVVEMNYDAFLDQVLCMSPSRAAKVLVDKTAIRAFRLFPKTGKSRLFRRMPSIDSASPDIFAEVLTEGRISFYARRAMVYCRMEDVNRNGRMIQLRKIAASTTYYVLPPGGKMLLVRRLSKKAFLKLFPESKSLTLKQKDGTKTDFRKEGGWSAAIALMNQR